MDSYVTSETIRSLRERKRLTQLQLAEAIGVTDKAISKWETGRGLPDITLLGPLAAALGVSVAELLSGTCAVNENRHANMRAMKLYVCPICGNFITSMGEGSYSCCGVMLPPLSAESCDEAHVINVEDVDGEYFVSVAHPMTKTHSISFIACVTSDRCDLVKLYPEGASSAHFAKRGKARFYAYCNKHGLFSIE